jgi:GH25 family lysozyme M1 (1,4-beta-N-acetylmuramidase)
MSATDKQLSLTRNAAGRGVPATWAILVALGTALGARPALAQRPIGVDVSSYQGGSVNWASAKAGGVSFAWAKATEGLTVNDADFTINEANAKAAGVLIGAYHFSHPELHIGAAGADQEADHFWGVASNYIKGGGAYLMPMLDTERFTNGVTYMSDWVNEWCSNIVNKAKAVGVNVKPVIYISACNACNYNSTVAQWIPWIASWNGQSPQTGTPWSTCTSCERWGSGVWNVWQYTDSTPLPGATQNADGDVFNGTMSSLISTLVITAGNSATLVSGSVPNGITTGTTFTATITLNNSGATVWTNSGTKPYRLGSQNPSNNTTWGFSRVNLPSSPINIGQNATFTFTATAPSTPGNYAFSWQMLQEPTNWFGDTFTATISVVIPGPGTNLGPYTLDTGNIDPTSYVGTWSTASECNLTVHYAPLTDASCNPVSREAKWFPGITPVQYSGRGWLELDVLLGGTKADAYAYYHLRDSADAELWTSPLWNQCSYHCIWTNVYSSTLTVPSSGTLGGVHIFTSDSGTNACGSCGSAALEAAQVRMFGARWNYIDDWTCLGGYDSTSVSDTANRSFNEANLYLYPAVDTSHGNTITAAMGLNGRTPGRVTTGDCNNANTLNFDNSTQSTGNADAFGHCDNCDAYGFAWVFAPSGDSPQIRIGSVDGNRLWVNGVLKNDTNAVRSLTRDQDNTGAVTLPPGWNRVLFKLHHFTNNFRGTVSLRNSTNANLNASVNSYDLGGYYSFGLGYEQDGWYPQIVVSNFYGAASPANAAAFYGNTTTVAVNGRSNGQGPVPYWRTMQYQWGYSLGNADSSYADVSGTPTGANWSHSTIGVTGHRRFYLFAVSQSGRTSFQNSGISGGSVFQDAGNYGRYYDVYVDDVAPLNPSFSSLTATDTTQISLAWIIPPDQGVNIGPGSDESAGAAGNQDSQNWYRVGDVGVQVYRNGSVISPWGVGTAMSDGGLAANTAYTYTLEARDNNTSGRGAWNNSTAQQDTNIAWTLSVPPGSNSITASATNTVPGSNITWTAAHGFGAGKVQYYRYAWDQSATHTFDDTEPQWSSGNIATMASSGGTWYLHVKGYNGADVGNGTYDYAVSVVATQPQILSITTVSGSVTITWSSVSGSNYRVQYNPDLSGTNWTDLSPDVHATDATASATDNPGGADQRFYRVLLLP